MDAEKRIKELHEIINETDFVAHRTRNISWAAIRRGGSAKRELRDLERQTGKAKGWGQMPYDTAKRLAPGLTRIKWIGLVRSAVEKGYPVTKDVIDEAARP